MILNASLLLTDIRSYIDFKEVSFKGMIKFFEPFSLKKGDLFYEPNIVPEYCPYVLKGYLRQYSVNEKGEEHTRLFAEENSWPGLLGSMRKKIPSPTGLIALEDCELLGITIENFYHLWEIYPEFGKYIMLRDEVDRTKQQADEECLKNDDAATIYRWLLVEKSSLIARLPDSYLADYIGITLEKLHLLKEEVR